MSEIRMTVDARTDYDCETIGLPSERWSEAVFKIQDESQSEELAFEVSVEKDVILAIMLDDNTAWKGTLKGFKQLIKSSMNDKK